VFLFLQHCSTLSWVHGPVCMLRLSLEPADALAFALQQYRAFVSQLTVLYAQYCSTSSWLVVVYAHCRVLARQSGDPVCVMQRLDDALVGAIL
jgi:hypothetical protein